jgi:hypothetical protein
MFFDLINIYNMGNQLRCTIKLNIIYNWLLSKYRYQNNFV